MKRILIVGATSAIATACARLWAAQGARFFLVARDAEKLAAVTSDLTMRGAAAADSFCMDANDTPAHSRMLAQALESLGELDIVLLAHGTLPNQSACETDAALAIKEFSTNAVATIALLTLVANQCERQRNGAIAVITSVAGDRGRPSNYVYGSAKAAVCTFCEGLRPRLFKAGVSLTDIRPGFVATPMTQGLPLPALLVAQPGFVATRIVSAIERKTDVLYTPAFWALIMMVVRNIPAIFYKRMKL